MATLTFYTVVNLQRSFFVDLDECRDEETRDTLRKQPEYTHNTHRESQCALTQEAGSCQSVVPPLLPRFH